MGTLKEDLSAIKEVEDKIIKNKVARFAYTDEAYKKNDANGVAEYNVNKEQNIPTADASVLKVNETVLSKGYRAQASSITRMLVNHFFGRMSYNLNKVNDIVSNLITTLIGYRGTANGFATLDENGRIPYSQLPESAMEYKGQWNAKTNTPTLADGTGTKGDFYVVSVAGTQNLGSGNIQFSANDRIIYDGSVWVRLSAGAVQTVNNISPTNGNVALTGENIPVSSTNPTLLSAPLTTERIADNAVTDAKIANNAVTNAKIADNAVTNAKIKDSVSVAKGGTGATDAKNGFMNLANGLTQSQNPQDAECMIYKSETNWGLYTLSTFWEYIKGKISSVLGLTKDNYGGKASTAGNADTVDNYHASQLWRSDGATWNPSTNVTMTPSGNDSEWSFDFRNKNGATGLYWQVWDENKQTLLRVKADDGKVYAPYGFVGNLSGKADTAGTADSARNMYYQNFDLSALDKTKFYPLVCYTGDDFAEVAIHSPFLSSGSAEYNQNRIHFDISTRGWSDLSPTLNIREYACHDNNEITIGCIGRGVHIGAWAIWLRGGLTYTCFTRNCNFFLHTSDYTLNDEVYTVGTNYYGGSNTNVEIVFTPQSTIKDGAYSSRPITAPSIKATTNFIGNLTGNATNAYSGMVHTCSTASGTKEKTVSIPGFTLTQGACIKVLFANGNSATRPTLNVNDTGAKEIYINKQGNLNFIVKDWDAGISMTLMFKGDSFVVLGNPIVKFEYLVTAGSGGTRNFIRYASGLLIQWGTVIVDGLTQQTIEAYSSSTSYSLLATPSDGAIGWIECLRHDNKTIKLGIVTVGGGYIDGTVSWLTIGW